MSNHTHAEHKEHVLPYRVYFGVFGALLVLTAITVYIAGFHFGAFNLIVAMAVAAIKASLVAMFFMHLKYDNKVYMLVFVSSIAFLAIFISFTMADTMTRGRVDPATKNPLVPEATIYRAGALETQTPHLADSATVDTMGQTDSLGLAAPSEPSGGH